MPAFTIPAYPERRVREYNQCHNPKGADGGKFCSEPGAGAQVAQVKQPVTDVAQDTQSTYGDSWGKTAVAEPDWTATADTPPIMQHVDPAQNAERFERELRPAQAALLDAVVEELQALPLVHGTSVEGAAAIAQHGIQSFADMADERAAAQEALAALEEDIERIAGEYWQDQYESYEIIDSEAVAQMFPDLDRHHREEVSSLMNELKGLQAVVAGTTHDADIALGLDRYAFLTHGQRHQDYGPVGVVISNSVLEDPAMFATPKDIVNYGGQTDEGQYSDRTIEAYRQDIVDGVGYYRAAAAETIRQRAPDIDRPIENAAGKILQGRGRDHLWEIKVPSVPASAVKTFFVDAGNGGTFEDAQRLAEKVGEGRVLYFDGDEMSGGTKWLYDQLKYAQAYGSWDTDAIDLYRDEVGGGGVMLF